MILSFLKPFRNAPLIFLGAFFLCASCKDAVKDSSPPVDAEPPPAAEPPPPAEPLPGAKPPAGVSPSANGAVEPADAEESSSEQIRFLSYNVRNYLTMTTYLRDGKRGERRKPQEEIKELVDLIVAQKPHVLGICEIGTQEDLLELQTKLKAAGLDLPHFEHAGGKDKTRHLGLLSSLPIKARGSEHHLPYQLDGMEWFMNRGILDVTIDLPNGPTHFIGVHLKSKREIPEADQAMIRLNEAQLLRKHCDAIQAKDPDARIVVYGDMNDTKNTPPIKAIKGHGRSKGFLEDVYVKDSRGEVWTHFWKYQHQYARFDYVFVSRSVKPEVNYPKSYIVDPADFYDASDHRAIMVTFGR